MKFYITRPEEPKERSPKLAVHGTVVPAICLRQLNVSEDGQEQRSVGAEARSRVPDRRQYSSKLYVSKHNLNVTRCGKLNQWSVT